MNPTATCRHDIAAWKCLTCLPIPETTTEPLNAFQLAALADVTSPDSKDSPGALWLEHVATVASEVISDNPGLDLDDLTDAITESADGAVPVYTHERFQVFVDLCAYTEDVTEFGPVEDMEQAAGIALYLIAERLIHAIIEESTSNGTV